MRRTIGAPGARPGDDRLMARALALGARGVGRTHPNPAVGAVVARGATVVGEGYHRRAGSAHAEVVALRRAGERARGATLYVTLEPCTHFGRTPPCVAAVLRAGVRRVVIGVSDPDPRVHGRGIRALRRAGLPVTVGVQTGAARELIAGYRTRLRAGRPQVVLKLAASLDGRIATASGRSRWITGPQARARVHALRDRLDAVMVGAGTVRTDDPRLTCRRPGGRDPVRIVVDGRLRMSPRARMLRVRSAAPTWIITAADASRRREASLTAAGAEVIRLPGRGRVRLGDALAELGRRGLNTVLIEGGATLAAAVLAAGLADRLALFLAPIVLGGDGVPAVGALGIEHPARAPRLVLAGVERVGGDLLVEASLPLSAVAL
jgi:diaminohydroxyphosphoribosylaminopyrimidine deaminase/5-amino-6-(5-phosphoribosylamino)uracil reductase